MSNWTWADTRELLIIGCIIGVIVSALLEEPYCVAIFFVLYLDMKIDASK